MSKPSLFAYLVRIDNELTNRAAPEETLTLHLLGRSAMILGYGLQLMTKDVDVVEDHSELLKIAIKLFGKESPKYVVTDFYLESVSSGLPPLPSGYQNRAVEIPGPWKIISPKRLEAHDLVVTKLRRFHQGDKEDIRILCDTGEIATTTLEVRFASANQFSDVDDPRFKSSRNNLNKVLEYLNNERRSL
jgi:hypothetical protein